MVTRGRRVSRGRVQLVGRSWYDAARELQDLLEDLIDSNDNGIPQPHGSTHDMDGSDPLTEPGDPEDVGLDADAGDGPAKANEDHVHGVPITTKGDLLTVISGALGRLAAGAYPEILQADANQPGGMWWAQPWYPIFSKDLTSGVQASLFHHAVDDLGQASGRVLGKVYAGDASDAQICAFEVYYSAIANSSGTITVFYEQRDYPVEGAVSGGTLAVVCEVAADEANNRITVKLTATTSLTATSFSVELRLETLEFGTVTLLW